MAMRNDGPIDGPRRIDVKAAGHAQQAGSIGFDPGWKWNGGWHGWQMGIGTESKSRWPGHRPCATAKMRQPLQPKAGGAELYPAAAKAATSPNLDRRAAPPVSPSDVLLPRPAGALAFCVLVPSPRVTERSADNRHAAARRHHRSWCRIP